MSGGGIRTCDLRVMSPTSYLTAPPRGGDHIVATPPTRSPPRAGRAEAARVRQPMAARHARSGRRAIDMGTNSTRLLVADVEDGG